ncbi:unnamed protein product [Phaeothamnion confervicola]
MARLVLVLSCLTAAVLGYLVLLLRYLRGNSAEQSQSFPKPLPTVKQATMLPQTQSCPIGTLGCPCEVQGRCFDNLLCMRQGRSGGGGSGGDGSEIVETCAIDPLRSNFTTRPDFQDPRPAGCAEKSYYKGEALAALPTASVVMAFYQESRRGLEYSVRSLLARSNWEKLLEIILVDDFNDEVVGTDVFSLPKVRVIRTTRREGLIRGRMLGASYARGDVIIFLDSHVEVAPGWLEPLLERIAAYPKAIAVPTIDTIGEEDEGFKYTPGGEGCGGFGLADLTFRWDDIARCQELQERLLGQTGVEGWALEVLTAPSEPYPSPAHPGGLYAIAKDWWHAGGEYDSGMELYGGENTEQSLRVWRCGGRIDMVPCSHIGHIFKRAWPYKEFDNSLMFRNMMRIANVWLDGDYRDTFYRTHNGVERNIHPGDVTERLRLQADLHCHDMNWFTKTIYPQLDAEVINATDLVADRRQS